MQVQLLGVVTLRALGRSVAAGHAGVGTHTRVHTGTPGTHGHRRAHTYTQWTVPTCTHAHVWAREPVCTHSRAQAHVCAPALTRACSRHTNLTHTDAVRVWMWSVPTGSCVHAGQHDWTGEPWPTWGWTRLLDHQSKGITGWWLSAGGVTRSGH